MVYADDVNILGGSEHTIKKNAVALIVASKEIELEVNADKSKFVVMYRDPNAGRSQNMKTENRSFEMAKEFKYLGKTLTNQNSMQEEITSRMKSGKACNHSVKNLLSPSLLSKNLKMNIYRTIVLPVMVCGCEAWSLTLREERRVRVFEKKVVRRI